MKQDAVHRWVDDGERKDMMLAAILATAPPEVVMQHKLLGMQSASAAPHYEATLRAAVSRAVPAAVASDLRILCTVTMCEIAGVMGDGAASPQAIDAAVAQDGRTRKSLGPGLWATGLLDDGRAGFVTYLPHL